jgi:hypothetical protein
VGLSEKDSYFSDYSYNTDGHVFNKHGRRVGSYSKKYGRICTKFGEVVVPRLLMFMHNGAWPDGEVDHINGNTHDDRLSNLRVCTREENAKNRRAYNSNSAGYKGVYEGNKRGKVIKYLASIQVDNERIYLGSFNTPWQAAAAYNKAAAEHHGKFASLNNKRESI